MKDIVVVGYPKSGCTWATRLVAELVGCPVAGFWHLEKKEIAMEGAERQSDFRCYKAHHQLSELGLSPNEIKTRVIYILRDPRDIAVSGTHHFTFHPFPRLARLFHGARPIKKIYERTLYPVVANQDYRLRQMTLALTEGCLAVHKWCRISWAEHWRPYEQAGVPIVRYEDLLVSPGREATRILDHLGLQRSPEEIAKAVHNQSFERKKETLLREGETGRARFLRVGRSGQWRTELPRALQAQFTEKLGPALAHWGYPAQ